MRTTNRFVRFGYRLPPPWKLPLSAESSALLTGRDRCAKAPQSIRKALKSGLENWSTLPTEPLPLKPVCIEQNVSVPALAHGMEVVLRGDGLYPLEAPWVFPRYQAPRKLFSDGLRLIVPPDRIAWREMPAYIPASKDEVLHDAAIQCEGVAFCSSTSSVTPSLSFLYHILSNFRDTGLSGGLSDHVRDLPATFSRMHRRPIAIALSRVRNEPHALYSVTAHSGEERGPSILRDLGHSMERMLTTPPTEFANKYVLQHMQNGNNVIDSVGSVNLQDSLFQQQSQFYHYTQASRMLLRAQIDCVDRANGEVFDVKTRAVAPIRYDLPNYTAFASHRLRFLQGRIDSYEREFYDMVRSVFLKYAFQLRIGRMSGALVAYHNTTEVLGLEYVRLAEMESYVFGSRTWADVAFGSAVRMFEYILTQATNALPPGENDFIKVVMYMEWTQLRMFVFAQRVQKGTHDAFGSEEFRRQESMKNAEVLLASDVDSFVGHAQWHLDSFLHQRMRGVAVIGSHRRIENLGGERVDDTHSIPFRKRPGTAIGSLDFRNYDYASLTPDTFRAWEIAVVPLINGQIAPRNHFELKVNDSFTLKFKMSEIKDINNDLLSKFILSLGTIYLR